MTATVHLESVARLAPLQVAKSCTSSSSENANLEMCAQTSTVLIAMQSQAQTAASGRAAEQSKRPGGSTVGTAADLHDVSTGLDGGGSARDMESASAEAKVCREDTAGGASTAPPLLTSLFRPTDEIRECPSDLFEEFPLVPRFVKQHAAVWQAAQGTPHYRWVGCLPLHDKPLRRCLELLDYLRVVQEMTCDPIRIFRCRSEPLWPELEARSSTDLQEMLEVAEYLQLPKPVCTRLLQHQAARKWSSEACGAGPATGVVDAQVIRDCPMLGTLLTQAMEKALDGRFPDMFSDRALCCASLIKESSAAADGALCTPVRLVKPGMMPEVSALYLAGNIIAGHAADADAILAFPAYLDASKLHETAWTIPAELAAGAGDVQLLERLHKAGWPCNKFTEYTAAARGHIDVLALLRKWSDSELDAACICFAALHGQAAATFWLRVRGAPWSTRVTLNAAWGGQRSLMAALWEAGCPIETDSWTAAVQEGHVHVLNWLYALYAREGRDLPWEADLCVLAAEHGRLEVLKWLRSQTPPCPWDASVIRKARTGELREWALANGCPVPEPVPAAPAH